jgi:hypothetical protein
VHNQFYTIALFCQRKTSQIQIVLIFASWP